MSDQAVLDIEETLKDYFDGLYTCDVDILSKAFHSDAIYATADESPLLFRRMPEYFEVVSKRESPASRLETRNETIISIDIAGENTAAVKVTCSFGGMDFVDFLTFIRMDAKWLIISKIFHISNREGS